MRVVTDGTHERFRIERMPFNLSQCLLPAACHFHIRHLHILYGLEQIEPFFRRTDTLSGAFNIIPFEQGGNDGCPCGRCTDSGILYGLFRLFIGNLLSTSLHGTQQGRFRVERLGQGLLLHQSPTHDGKGFPFGKYSHTDFPFQFVSVSFLPP